MDKGRKVEVAFGFLIGAIGILCLVFVVWFISMMIIHKVLSAPGLALLGLGILITWFFLNTARKAILNPSERLLSTFTLYTLAMVFFSLAALFCIDAIWKHNPNVITGIICAMILGYWCIRAELLLKNRGTHGR
ncbi:MAG: hypothetical protein ACM3ZT_09445 [Bacillota bacterium]